MVLGAGHTHAALHPFVIFPAMELVPLISGSDISACSGVTAILEFTCRRTGRVARLCDTSLGRAAGRVTKALLVLGTLLFQVCGQSN